jgi:hypothetical protein
MTLRIPHPKTSLHLYRHLLREAGYLPPLATSFVRTRIRHFFRKRRDVDTPSQCKAHVREGHHKLRFLRAANAGDARRMRNVLLAVFGRSGRRRRELMTKLVEPEPPVDTAALSQAISDIKTTTTIREGRKEDWLDKWNAEKVRALAQAQLQHRPDNSPRPKIPAKSLYPEKLVPRENIWGLPLTEKAARAKLKQGWRVLANRLLPPVPKSQWELLADLAYGRKSGPEWAVPSRRAVADSRWMQQQGDGGIAGSHADEPWDWQKYATQKVRLVDRQKARSRTLLSGQTDDTSPMPGQPTVQHNYTARWWRRRYADVWSLTPLLEATEGGKGWTVTWGKSILTSPKPGPRQMELFEGIGTTGKKPRAPRSKPRPLQQP